ncbi:MAG: hypothetical protein IRZ10_11445 [Thermoflavifilum sp.]|nr:hypothetical protein [Thermoflavifilum sp.]MCL6515016.1 hypothetical protein [Alicyclobacillus sp.]
MAGVWAWHVMAGILGVVLSLSAVYQMWEKRWHPHQPVDPAGVRRATGPGGRPFSDDEVRVWTDKLNRAPYLGGLSKWDIPKHHPDVCLILASGEQVRLYLVGDIWTVVRRTSRGRERAYRLLDPDGSRGHGG